LISWILDVSDGGRSTLSVVALECWRVWNQASANFVSKLDLKTILFDLRRWNLEGVRVRSFSSIIDLFWTFE
jgi:hypothetical protein